MTRCIVLASALAALSACSPPQSAQAPSVETPAADAAPQSASVSAPAGADAAITAWYREQLGASLIEPVTIFYGDFTGDVVADALAWGYFNTDGNSTDHRLALFRNDGGRMTHMPNEAAVDGSDPRNVNISNGRITLTTTVPLPSDLGCCPTGSQDWTIETD